MYLEFYGLESKPFSLTPDPRFLLFTALHREALAGLLLTVTERRGFMVLSGAPGTGKTTLLGKLLASVPASSAQFSVIVNPTLTRTEFLESVLIGFGHKGFPESKPQRLVLCKELLLSAHTKGRASVLVIDEAHLLSEELIEEVRLLSNLETADQKLLQIILVGQEELEKILELESARPLRQRIAMKMRIGALDESVVENYLECRWIRAGSRSKLPFSKAAIALIAESSKGVPRIINALCDAALVNAYGRGMHDIGTAQIEEVIRELGLPAAVPSTASPSAAGQRPRAASEIPADSVPRLGNQEQFRGSLRTLETYLPEAKPARGWKFAHWFRPAQSEVK